MISDVKIEPWGATGNLSLLKTEKIQVIPFVLGTIKHWMMLGVFWIGPNMKGITWSFCVFNKFRFPAAPHG